MRDLDRILLPLVRRFLSWIGTFSPARCRFWSELIGNMIFTLDRKHRRIALDNLQRAFGTEKTPAQRSEIARSVFANMVRMIFEIGWYQSSEPHRMAGRITIWGEEEGHRAQAKGKGILVLTGHFGNWEMLPLAAHLAKLPASIVYRPLDSPLLDRFFQENRTRFGAKPIPTRRGAMLHIFKELRRGHAVAMLMDQNVDWYEGAFVDFFNSRACTNIGMATVALRTGAPVLPVFVLRKEDLFHVVVGPELPLIRTGDPVKDVELNTEQYNKVIEIYARRFPDQWFWVHQRWKTKPYSLWPRVQPNGAG